MLRPNEVEVEGGEDNDGHVTPAVEGVEQAHLRFLVLGGTGLGDGGDQDLGESSAHGVQENGDQDAHKGSRQDAGQKSQTQKSQRRKDMGNYGGGAVAPCADVLDGDEVHDDLHPEVHRHQHGHLRQGDVVVVGEGNEEQRDEIDHDGLGNVAQIAGRQGVLVGGTDAHITILSEKFEEIVEFIGIIIA